MFVYLVDRAHDQKRNGLLGLGSARAAVPLPQPVLQQLSARTLGPVAGADLVHRRSVAVLLAGKYIHKTCRNGVTKYSIKTLQQQNQIR